MQIRCFFLLLLLFPGFLFGAFLSIGNNDSFTSSGNATYTGLTMGNNSSLTVLIGHTLTINGAATSNNGLGITVQNGGTLIITGCLTGNNNFNLNIAGDITLGCIDVDNNGSLTVQGTGNVTVTGNIVTGQNTTINVALNGELTVGGNVTIGTGTSSVTVNGTFHIEGQYSGVYPSGSGNMDDLNESFLPAYLPVELKEIKLACIDDRVKIQWITATEYNSSHYSILHSLDGENWTVLSTILSAGVSTDEIEYSYIDIIRSQTSNYYKIIQNDIDGLYVDFGPLTSNCNSKLNQELSTYPNPSNGNFTLQISTSEQADAGIYTLNLREISGRVMNTQKIELEVGNTSIYFNDLKFNSGYYTVELIHESGRRKVTRHTMN